MANKKVKDLVMKENRVVVGSLKDALALTEGVHEALNARFRGGDSTVSGTATVAASMACSHLRRALRTLGVAIPVRKGPKPGTLSPQA